MEDELGPAPPERCSHLVVQARALAGNHDLHPTDSSEAGRPRIRRCSPAPREVAAVHRLRIGASCVWSQPVRVHPGSDTVDQVIPVVVLNGGSSSGKTSIARCLQRLLGPTWMTLGVDDLVRALPGGDDVDELMRTHHGGETPVGTEGSIAFGPGGSVILGGDFRRAEASWYAGLAAIGRCGTGLILDEVFMGGRSSQERLAAALSGLRMVWVGVGSCAPDVAAARERARPDRVCGMARLQAERVHEGVVYDLAVDTSAASAADCARAVASHLALAD